MSYVHAARQAVAAELPSCSPELLTLYTVLALTKGRATTSADVHDAWSLATMDARPEHPCLRPYPQLGAETQALDVPYRDGIHRAAASLLPESGATGVHG
ncbi:DUF7701 domain-containing protein [Actinopolyspora erythraea]|uniref:DUF7701 domain-containing protein n=1 Tax=Actinopolyspora erythraea TaxID=414996 RepID=UPI0006937676|nr:hypothetical protein [Actinopolyspora erythraea]